MTDVLQQARDGAEYLRTGKGRHVTIDEVIAALDAAIAQRGEPVAWVDGNALKCAEVSRQRGGPFDVHAWSEGKTDIHNTQLYTDPPARVPLTDEQIDKLCVKAWGGLVGPGRSAVTKQDRRFARAIERAHGITGA